MTKNDKSTQPGREGLYRVNKERALHWTVRGITSTWATAGQAVDLTSQYLSEYVQRTGQMHKLTRIEKLKPGEQALCLYGAPQPVRNAYEAFHKSGKGADMTAMGKGLPSLEGAEPPEPEAPEADAASAEPAAGDAGEPGKPDPLAALADLQKSNAPKTTTPRSR